MLAEGIRAAYADLFQVNIGAQKLNRSELVNKFKTLSQGQLTDSVLDKLALTFTELVKLADFSSASDTKRHDTEDIPDPDDEKFDRRVSRHSSNLSLGGLHYNIQIILPMTRDTKVYDAIFKSLREHLT